MKTLLLNKIAFLKKNPYILLILCALIVIFTSFGVPLKDLAGGCGSDDSSEEMAERDEIERILFAEEGDETEKLAAIKSLVSRNATRCTEEENFVAPGFEAIRVTSDVNRQSEARINLLGREYLFARGAFPTVVLSGGREVFTRIPEYKLCIDGSLVNLNWGYPLVRKMCPGIVRLQSHTYISYNGGVTAFTDIEYNGKITIEFRIGSYPNRNITKLEYLFPISKAEVLYNVSGVSYDQEGRRLVGIAEGTEEEIPERLELNSFPESGVLYIGNRNFGIGFISETSGMWTRGNDSPIIIGNSGASETILRLTPVDAPVTVSRGYSLRDTISFLPEVEAGNAHETVVNPADVFANGTADGVVVDGNSLILAQDEGGHYVSSGMFTSPVIERQENVAIGNISFDTDIPVHNLLNNPGFEQGTSGWTPSGAPADRFFTSDEAREGSSALVIDARGDSDSLALQRMTQYITIEPNRYYRASVDFRFSGLPQEVTLYYRVVTFPQDNANNRRHHPDSQNHFESNEWRTINTLFKTTDTENRLEIEPAVQPFHGRPVQVSLDNMVVTKIDYARLQIKSSPDGNEWSAWSDVILKGKTSILIPAGRYFQYRIMLNTDDTSKTPRVRTITFSTCGNFVQDRWETKESCRHDFRPFLFFEREDIPALRTKREGNPPPDNRWGRDDWSSSSTEVETALAHRFQTGVVPLDSLHRQFRDDVYTRILAFSYLMTEEPRFAQKAKEGLLYEDISFEYIYHVNLFFGQLGMETAQVYDWILNEPSITAEEKVRMRNFLGNVAYRLYVLNSRGVGRRDSRNMANPGYVGLSGLGMIALALPDYSHPIYGSSKEWLELAYQELFGTFTTDSDWMEGVREKNMVDLGFSEEGYYLEGPSYWDLVAQPLMTFMAAYEKVKNLNLFRTPKIEKMIDYGIMTLLPYGTLPQNNDSSDMPIPLPIVAGKYLPEKAPYYYWHNYVQTTGGYGDKIMNFLSYDPTIQPKEPEWAPSRHFVDTGNIIFKSDWSRESTWMYILGKTRTPGHYQADQTSFSLWSHGQYLLPESGYGPSDRWIASAEAHNLILADGKGPIDILSLVTVPDKTDIDYFFDESFMKGANIRINYLNSYEQPHDFERSDVFIERNFVFPFGEYFVVFDTVKAERDHNYDNLLHFGNNIDGAGELALAGNLADWRTTGNAQLLAYMNGNGVDITRHTGRGNKRSKDVLYDVTYIKGRTHGEDVSYLTFLYPKLQNEPDPQFNDISANGVVATMMVKNNKTVIAGTRVQPGQTMRVRATQTDAQTDAQSFLLHQQGEEPNSQTAFFIRRGSTLYNGNRTLFWSTRQARVAAFHLTGNNIVGYLDAPSSTTARIHGSGIATVTINGQQTPFSQKDGYVEIEFN